MNPQDPRKKDETMKPRREEHESPERTVAPPIEREHETFEGVVEEDERREHERE